MHETERGKEVHGSIPRCDSVLMVGTHPRTQGGIATVVRGYIEAKLFDQVPSTYVPTHRDGSALSKLLRAIAAIVRVFVYLLRGKRPLVHIHMSSRASFWRKAIVCMMARAARRPYIVHMHGSEFMVFHDSEAGPRTKAFISYILRHAVLVLALSEEWKQNLLRISPQAKVEVMPNAVPLPDLATRSAAPAEAPRILFSGRLGQRKGTFDLIRAFASIAPRFPQAHLICAGDGAVSEVMALAKELGIAGQVTCTGWLDAQSLQRELASASLFVLPSHAEGLPMALLEAMSWNLPVVVTPVGGIPTVVRDGENGLLVPPGNPQALAAALERLLQDSTLRERLGAAARAAIVADYSLEALIARLLALYARFGIPRTGKPVHNASASVIGNSAAGVHRDQV